MDDPFTFAQPDIAALMPLYLRLDAEGAVRDIGPTLVKMRSRDDLLGRHVSDVFEITPRRKMASGGGFEDMLGGLLKIRFRDAPQIGFKGMLVPLVGGGYLLNLSLGIGVIQAVGAYGLSAADFSDTDLTIEMLYLNEAKSAVLRESRELVKRLQGAKIAAEEKAFTDTLTGLKNRRAMDFVLCRLIRANEEFGLMHLDLDLFKAVNDTMGHAAGDYVLQHVARVLVSETRGEDTVARVGGDEFVVILKGLIDIKVMRIIGERIIRSLEKPISFNGAQLRIGASVGATVSANYRAPEAARMLHHADLALYASKRAGRGVFTAWEPDMA